MPEQSASISPPRCPSCLDNAHGDCLLWNAPDCACNCIKRCHVRHPAESLKWIGCQLPAGHQSHHQHITEWVNNKLPGWELTEFEIGPSPEAKL